MNNSMLFFAYLSLSFAIGALVGLAELLSRYSWSVHNIGKSIPGLAYLGLNGFVAIIAYMAAIEWGFHAGIEGKSEGWRVFIISLMAMAFLRSSFANLRFGDKEFSAGLASFVEIFMRRAEKSLDKQLTQERLTSIIGVVEGLTYTATRNYLMAMCEGALRSISGQEINTFRDDVDKIDQLEVDDATRMQLFALRIVELTDLKLFCSFAKAAKVKLVREIEIANEQRVETFRRLTDAKIFLNNVT